MEHILNQFTKPSKHSFSGLPHTILRWESKRLSNEKFTPYFTSNKSLSPKLVWHSSKTKLKFTGSCLKQEDNAAYTPSNVVDLYIVYELDSRSQDLNPKLSLRDCLFGNIKITKNADLNKYSYSGYGIGFDSRSLFWIPNFDWGKNVIIFGVDMRSSVHTNNISILGQGQTQGLDNTTLTAEAQYSTNFSRLQREFCLSLHYNESNSFLFVNGTKIHQLKAKDCEMEKCSLCLGNISNGNMKTTGLNGYVYVLVLIIMLLQLMTY